MENETIAIYAAEVDSKQQRTLARVVRAVGAKPGPRNLALFRASEAERVAGVIVIEAEELEATAAELVAVYGKAGIPVAQVPRRWAPDAVGDAFGVVASDQFDVARAAIELEADPTADEDEAPPAAEKPKASKPKGKGK